MPGLPAIGCHEKQVIEKESGSSPAGIRMHWLYFSEKSHEILDKTGFAYDSTIGYNETIGYRAGTAQAYRPPGSAALLELPLHIQDVALFSPLFLNLTEKKALPVCRQLLETTKKHGGAVTLLWHFNTIGPKNSGEFMRRSSRHWKTCMHGFQAQMRWLAGTTKGGELLFTYRASPKMNCVSACTRGAALQPLL